MKYFIIIACSVLLFSNCFDTSPNKGKVEETSIDAYVEQGQKIAMMTFATLSRNLQEAMKEGGVSNAVTYCNIAASPLVDSLKQVYQVDIKRTSLKTRNLKNQPTKSEQHQLLQYQQQFETGEELKPVVQKTDHEVAYYAPIQVMPLCQKCHGKIGEQLTEEDYEIIQKLYPSDRAINYQSGDLRGMWSITFYE